MKFRIVSFIYVVACFLFGAYALPALADTKISALPAGSTITGTEVVPGVQSAATVKFTASQINTYVQGQLANATFTPAGAWKFAFIGVAATPSLSVDSTTPVFELRDTDGAVNGKRWRLSTPTATTLALGPLSDDGLTFAQALVLTRSAATTTQIDLNATDVRINGTTVSINSNPVSTSQSGTFTAAWVNGCSNDPVQSFRYTLNGNVVVIQMFGATSCTTDANNKSTATGALPVAIRPANQQQAKYTNINVAGTPTDMCLTLQPDGQIQLHVGLACGTNPPASDFTISAAEQTSLTYLIN